MGTTPPPHERRIKRYDLREAVVFQRMIAERPWSALLLAVLIALIGTAIAMGWVPPSRVAKGFGLWFAATLAWLLALVVAFLAIRALRAAPPDQKE